MGTSEGLDVGAMPVAELTTDGVLRIPADATLLDAADAMDNASVGALIVGTDDATLGIVTERDLVRALAHRLDPAATPVIEIAHTSLVTCKSTATVGEVAVEMMEHYVRHVLVEDGNQLIGLVSARDLLGAYAAADAQPTG